MVIADISCPYSYLQAGVFYLAADGLIIVSRHLGSGAAFTSAPSEGPWQSSS